MKFSHASFIALTLCSPLLSGCWQAAVPIASAIVSVVTDSFAVLNIVERGINTWFRHKPDPEAEAVATDLLNKAAGALRVASAATRGAESLTQEEYDAAFLEFREAYAELHSFLKSEGILKGNKLGFGPGYEEEIPQPAALDFKVQ